MSDSDLYGAGSSTYENIFTYMGRPLSRELGDNVDAVVMGVPYDLGTSARAGARYGPRGIRQASAQLRWEKKRWPWTFALDDVLKVNDYGDLPFDTGKSEAMLDSVIAHASRIIAADKYLLTFGGDHFVSWPLLQAVSKRHKNIALVHFDAHTDTEETDLEFYHGSMFYRALEAGLIDAEHSIQLGIRTEYDRDKHRLAVLDANWVQDHSAEEAAAQILRTTGKLPVYLSIDIDFLDPAFAPGTGTPVAGGVSTNKLLQIIRSLTPLDIIAADIMEVAPPYDHAEITSLAAATLALELLYLRAARAQS